MTEPIIVPVSAPGATEAARSMDAAAASAEHLARSEKLLASLNQHLAKTNREVGTSAQFSQQQIDAAAQRAVQRLEAHTAAVNKNKFTLMAARNEARKYAEEQSKGGGGGHGGGGALYMASRAFPGHEMQIMNAGRMLGGAGTGALAVVAPLAIAVGALAGYLKVTSAIIEEHNHIAMEGLKIDQQFTVARRDALWKLQGDAANTAGGMRKSVRTILNSDPEGERLVKEISRTGMGAEGMSAMARLLKTAGSRFGGMTGSGILEEAKAVRGETGMELTDIIEGMGSSQGRYNRSRFVREQMGRTYSPELRAMWKERGDASETGGLMDEVERNARMTSRFQTGNALDANMVMPGMDRAFKQLTDPVVLAVAEHNRKIDEQMAIQQQIVDETKTVWRKLDEAIGAADPTNRLWHTAVRDAAREKTVLSKGKR